MANVDVLCMWMDSVDNRLDLLRKAGEEQTNIIKLQYEEINLLTNTVKLLSQRVELLENTITEMKGE